MHWALRGSSPSDVTTVQATQVLKADDEREFVVVRDEYKGGEIRLSLRKVEVLPHSHAEQFAYSCVCKVVKLLKLSISLIC